MNFTRRATDFSATPAANYARQARDPYVPAGLLSRFGIREGAELHGRVTPSQNGRGPRLVEITSICNRAPEDYANQPDFEARTPVSPCRRLRLETDRLPVTTRIMDLLTPVGLGQRGLIVAPPKTGKTTLLEHISHGVAENHPNVRQVRAADRRTPRRSNRFSQ